MLAHVISIALLAIDNYLLMDSVIVDLDDPSDFLPASLRWTESSFDDDILNEFMDIITSPAIKWKREKRVYSRNMTVSSAYLPAYKRTAFLATAPVEASPDLVTSTLWPEWTFAHHWNSLVVNSKMITYGGANKYTYWALTPSSGGGLLSSRDFVSYCVLFLCVTKLEGSEGWTHRRMTFFGAQRQFHFGKEEEDCQRHGTHAMVCTNTSGHFDYRGDHSAVRAIAGTCGFLVVESGNASQPRSHIEVLVNSELFLNSLLPQAFIRRSLALRGLEVLRDLQDFFLVRSQTTIPKP